MHFLQHERLRVQNPEVEATYCRRPVGWSRVPVITNWGNDSWPPFRPISGQVYSRWGAWKKSTRTKCATKTWLWQKSLLKQLDIDLTLNLMTFDLNFATLPLAAFDLQTTYKMIFGPPSSYKSRSKVKRFNKESVNTQTQNWLKVKRFNKESVNTQTQNWLDVCYQMYCLPASRLINIRYTFAGK